MELLETTDKTISEIAFEVGFSGASYFTECSINHMDARRQSIALRKKEFCYKKKE